MRDKSFMISRAVISATVAASVIAATLPADAAASFSKAEQAVGKAEKLGTSLKWETTYEYRKAKYPNSPVGYPNMKLFNDTKKVLADARKAVSALKGKEKEVLSARLDANVALYVNRTATYIDAVTSGLKIQKKTNELKALCDKGIVDAQTEKLYNELNAEIKKSSYLLDRVYGETTRSQFRAIYKQPAVNLVNQLLYPLTIKKEIDRTNAALKVEDVDKAAQHLGNVDFFLKEAAKGGQTKSDQLISGLIVKQKAAQADFNKNGLLYVAKSSQATFGPVNGTEAIEKNVYVFAGAKEQLTLKNVSINGKLVILGSPAGTGSVSLEKAQINQVVFKATAQVIISADSKVKEMVKDPSITGEVKVMNQGVVEKAEGTIFVSGNAPGLPGNSGSKSEVAPKFLSVSANAAVPFNSQYVNDGQLRYTAATVLGTYDPATSTYTISLEHLNAEGFLIDFEIKTSNAKKFIITYINSEKSNPVPRNVPLEYMISGDSRKIETGTMFYEGGYAQLKYYRDKSGKYMKLIGNLIGPNNEESPEITIIINY